MKPTAFLVLVAALLAAGCSSPKAEPVPAAKTEVATPSARTETKAEASGPTVLKHPKFSADIPAEWRTFNFADSKTADVIAAMPEATDPQKLAKAFLKQAADSKLVAAVVLPTGDDWMPGTMLTWIVTPEKATLKEYQKNLPEAVGVKPFTNEIYTAPDRLIVAYNTADKSDPQSAMQTVVQGVYVGTGETLTFTLSGAATQQPKLVELGEKIAKTVRFK